MPNTVSHLSPLGRDDMLSPYQLENLKSLVNGDLVLLERKYLAHPHLELWERSINMCLVDCYDEMVRDLCGISYEDWFNIPFDI